MQGMAKWHYIMSTVIITFNYLSVPRNLYEALEKCIAVINLFWPLPVAMNISATIREIYKCASLTDNS